MTANKLKIDGTGTIEGGVLVITVDPDSPSTLDDIFKEYAGYTVTAYSEDGTIAEMIHEELGLVIRRKK